MKMKSRFVYISVMVGRDVLLKSTSGPRHKKKVGNHCYRRTVATAAIGLSPNHNKSFLKWLFSAMPKPDKGLKYSLIRVAVYCVVFRVYSDKNK